MLSERGLGKRVLPQDSAPYGPGTVPHPAPPQAPWGQCHGGAGGRAGESWTEM